MADLNNNELEALRILWGKGDLKPGEVQEEFAWPIENATLRSVLNGLVEKGLLVREKDGKAFRYRAEGSPQSILTRMARMMAHVFAGGSTTGLIAQLIQTERVSPKELDELRRIAKGSMGKGAAAKGKEKRS